MKRTISKHEVAELLARVTAVEALIGRKDAPVGQIMDDLGNTSEDTLAAADWNTLDEGHYAAHKLAELVREMFTVQVAEAALDRQEARNAS